jgi:uncharacterized protein (DUF1499 family)
MLFARPVNRISHRLARLAFASACVAALCVGISGPLHRFFVLDADEAIAVFRYGFYLAAAAIALGLATVVPTRPGERRRGFLAAVLAITIGLAAAWSPFQWFLEYRQVPEINDVTTDLIDPPLFNVTLQLRRDAVTPAAYPGRHFAELQRAAYPDIQPVTLALPPSEAFKRIDRVALEMGWEVVARAPGEGRLEAVDSTAWFGFRDDVVIRIRAEGPGSRIDIRSKSRAGRSDLGVNARRIRDFTQRLRSAG